MIILHSDLIDFFRALIATLTFSSFFCSMYLCALFTLHSLSPSLSQFHVWSFGQSFLFIVHYDFFMFSSAPKKELGNIAKSECNRTIRWKLSSMLLSLSLNGFLISSNYYLHRLSEWSEGSGHTIQREFESKLTELHHRKGETARDINVPSPLIIHDYTCKVLEWSFSRSLWIFSNFLKWRRFPLIFFVLYYQPLPLYLLFPFIFPVQRALKYIQPPDNMSESSRKEGSTSERISLASLFSLLSPLSLIFFSVPLPIPSLLFSSTCSSSVHFWWIDNIRESLYKSWRIESTKEKRENIEIEESVDTWKLPYSIVRSEEWVWFSSKKEESNRKWEECRRLRQWIL